MRSQILLFFFVGLTMNLQNIYAKDFDLSKISIPSHILEATLPPVLFHWTDDEGLRRMQPESDPRQFRRSRESDIQVTNPGKLPLVRNWFGTATYMSGKLASSYVLYTWTNPITGMGTDLELYARAKFIMKYKPLTAGLRGLWERLKYLIVKRPEEIVKTESSARVVTIYPDPNATFDIFISRVCDGSDCSFVESEFVKKVKNPDFVLHVSIGGSGRPIFQEWLIMNSEKVLSFSADPEWARPYIEHELSRIANSGIPKEEYVIFRQPIPTRYREILNDTLQKGTQGISNYFNQSPPPTNCGSLLAPIQVALPE